MRFLLMHRVREDEDAVWNPGPELVARMDTFIRKLIENGVLITGDGVHKSAKGATVRKTGAAIQSTDGPFTEAKEVIGGFAMIHAKDLVEATAIAEEYIACFAEVEEMSVEVRQVIEPDELPQF